MSEKVSIKLPPHLACYLRPETVREEKLRLVRDEAGILPNERATVLVFLCYDKDAEVRSRALTAVRGLSLSILKELVSDLGSHPRILDTVARLHSESAEIVQLLLTRADIMPETAEFIMQKLLQSLPLPDEASCQPDSESDEPVMEGDSQEESESEAGGETLEDEPGKEVQEEEEAIHMSKYQLAQVMGVGEKIKMALTGDKEWRSLLIKDSNKLVNGAVVKNPRVTEAEILTISKSVIQNDEIIRVICHNKDWVKKAEIRKALVLNNKTPLTEKELAAMAKSKNISSILANQARRILSTKKKS
jgi:hypothetical protein